MSKLCVQRGDIWIANLVSARGDVLKGKHPVIIVSSDRNNRRSGVVTVVPLTSSVKPPMIFHVEISGYGLRRKSTALTEQLTTIPKTYLQFAIGSIADTEKMLELERALKLQLEVLELQVRLAACGQAGLTILCTQMYLSGK